MKSILYVYHVSSVGGGSYCLLNVLKTVDRSKYKPIVLLREDGPLVAEIKALGIDVHFFPEMQLCLYNTSLLSLSSQIHEYKLRNSISKFGTILKSINPDILYLNSMMFNPYLPIAKKLGYKTVIHVREHWPENEHTWQRKSAIDNILNYADEVVAINSYSASMVKDFKKPATIVYDWIDMKSRYQDMPLDSVVGEDCSNLKVFMFTGGLQVIKGTREVIETFVNEMKEPTYRLLLLGMNPDIKTGGIKGIIKKFLMAVGYTPYSDGIYQMIKSDPRIICIPATYNLTHLLQQVYCVLTYFVIPHANLALAEGVICHTPFIAADTEESREYSNNGELALLYEMNNRRDFIKAVESLPEQINNLKERLQKKSEVIEKMFDPKLNADRLNTVYAKFDQVICFSTHLTSG